MSSSPSEQHAPNLPLIAALNTIIPTTANPSSTAQSQAEDPGEGPSTSAKAIELQEISTRGSHLSPRNSQDREASFERARLIEGGSDWSEQDSDEAQPMNRRKRSKKANGQAEPHANEEQNGDMNIPIERKHSTIPNSTAAQANHAIRRDSFSLDDDPLTPTGPEANTSHGFFDLPRKDQRNFLVLIVLYFLQGIPTGLATGSVPFLLKKFNLSYGQIGVFSLAIYPYSLKILWSPIVDAVWSPKVGRRKSWILPVQTLSGIGMIWLGSQVQGMLTTASSDGGAGIWGFTAWWFFLVFTCATQDIAVDGWAITLLSQKNLAYASTAQSVGLTGGSFLSYTVFLALNSEEFAVKYFGYSEGDGGLVSLGGFLTLWGWVYLLVTIGLAVLKREDKTDEQDGIIEVYKTMGGILTLKNVQTIIVIHLIAKIGFQANDAATNLKLIDKGFSQDDLALVVLIDFPVEMTLGYYVGKWCSYYPPMHVWSWGFMGRLVAAGFAQFVVSVFPAGGTTTWYLILVVFANMFSTFMMTVQFVAAAAFHAKIADPVIGGTYMTMLATVANLGGTFPRFFVLKLIDAFTSATCKPQSANEATKSAKPGFDIVTSSFSCAQQKDRDRCTNGGGICDVARDGYYMANVLCIIAGTVTFWLFIRPRVYQLQALPLKAWRLATSEQS